MSYEKSNFYNKEIKDDEIPTLQKYDIHKHGTFGFDLHIDEGENLLNKDEHVLEKRTYLANSVENYNFICGRNRKITINKSLFAFRVTQFLLSGAGSLPSIFLGVFLKQRGLTLLEISSIFSMIFVFQFVSCFITGVITDKIGNAKPVLIFLMLSTSSVLFLMFITPNINRMSCSQIKYANESESSRNFSSCYDICLHTNNNNVQTTEKYSENVTVVEIAVNYNMSVCDYSSIPLANDSFHLLINDCCNMCKNESKSDCINVRNSYLVVTYAILVLALYSVWNTSFRFMDYTALSLAAENDSHYGKERTFAVFGSLLTTTILAFALNTHQSSGSEINYDPVIYIAAGVELCAFFSLLTTKVPILPPGKNLMKKTFGLLTDIDTLAFIVLVFIAGNGFGFFAALHLVFLETLNTPSMVVSLHSVIIILYAFPVLLTSQWWLKKFGANKLFVLGLLSHTVNNIAYSYILNPWWSLLIDVTITFYEHLFWVAVVVHCRNVAPVGLAATLNALTGAVHFGIGRSSGVFFGGMLMNYMGPRTAYRIMAAIFFTSAILYSIFLFIRCKFSPGYVLLNDNKIKDSKILKEEYLSLKNELR